MKGIVHKWSVMRWHYGYLRGLVVVLGCYLSSMVLAVDVTVSDAKIRAMPPIFKNTMVYVMIKNNDHQPVDLVAADVMNHRGCPIADKVELHAINMENGVRKMKCLTSISIKPGETARLESGGNHILVKGLNQPLKIGEDMVINLLFSDGSRITVDAPVMKILTNARRPVIDHPQTLKVLESSIPTDKRLKL